jgi:hypothetical protein
VRRDCGPRRHRFEFGGHISQLVVVERFPDGIGVGQQYAEPGVELVERCLRLGHDRFPSGDGGDVPGLKFHDAGPGAVGEVRVGVEHFAGGPVERVQGGDCTGAGGKLVVVPGRIGVFIEVLDEHAELGAPVAEVVLPDHVCAEEAEDAGQRVADDRRAQMPDVHFLGHVRRGVVDDGATAEFGGRDSEA